MPEAWRGATCGPWPSNRHGGWCACVCMGVCWCVWFKLNAPFNQFCWHALLALPALLGDSLSLPLLNSFQYLQRNECVIIPSRHDPILSPHPLSPPSLALLQSVPNSIFAFAFALFIYLFIVMLVYCFAFDCLRRLLAKGCGQHFWLYIRISHSPSQFYGQKTETDFIQYVTQHFIMHYSCYYILQGMQRERETSFLWQPFCCL